MPLDLKTCPAFRAFALAALISTSAAGAPESPPAIAPLASDSGRKSQPATHSSKAEGRLLMLAMDMTKEGKKLKPASPEEPVYYLPVYTGYKEIGDPQKFYEREPPAKADVRASLRAALAKQGYLVARGNRLPSIRLVFEWGTIAPIELPGFVSNSSQIHQYVAGDAARHVDGHGAYDYEMMSTQPRRFLIVSAFRLKPNARNEEVLLWRAHATTEAWGNYLDETLPSLITAVAPVLGREMKPGATWGTAEGRVIIGTPVVVDSAKPN